MSTAAGVVGSYMEVKTSSDLYEEWLFGGVEVMGNGKRPPTGFQSRRKIVQFGLS